MPFTNLAQARACYAQRARGNSTWDCDEWASHTDFKRLRRKKRTKKVRSKKRHKRLRRRT